MLRQRSGEVVAKHVAWRWGAGRLPSWLNLAPSLTLASKSAVSPPWPDLWIAAGRATLALSRRMRRWSRGRTFVVQLQDPRGALDAFDLVIPPTHDEVRGSNVFPILGSPNRVSRERLDAEAARWADRLDALPRPRVAALIGGKSRAHDLSVPRAQALAEQIAQAVATSGGSLMLTFSRRTPPAAAAAMTARLKDLPGLIWDGRGDNPYFAFLGAADAMLVTEDSTNMATDAAAAGKGVLRLALDGGSRKLRRFHADLEARGVARPFQGEILSWSYPPLAETDRAATEVLRRLDAARMVALDRIRP